MQIASDRVDITPEAPLPLVGYFRRQGVFTGISDRIEANLVLLRTEDGIVAIVSLDSLFGSDALRDLIVNEVGDRAPSFSVILVASHTHFAPGLDRRKPRLGNIDEGYIKATAKKISGKISVALDANHWQEVHLRQGRANCLQSTYRRALAFRFSTRRPFVRRRAVLSPNTKINHPVALDIVVAEAKNGVPLMVLWSWPCHAVSQPDQHMVSADFPGAVRRSLREHTGNDRLPVLYFPGFSGDIRPLSKRSALALRSFRKYPFSFLPTFKPNTAESFRSLCRGVSEAAISAYADLGPPLSSHQPFDIESRMVPLKDLIEGFQADPDSATAPPSAMPISLIENDLMSLLFIGAEICSTYTPHMPKRPQPIVLRTGYSGECFGYLPTDQQIAEGGLEGDWFFQRFSLPGKFKPEIQDKIVSAVSSLYDIVSANRNSRDSE